MIKPTKANYLDVIIFLLVLLFIYAATSKLIAFDQFQAQISKSPLIMNHTKIISIIVPSLEILISALLLIPKTQQIGLYASFTLMFMFTSYISFILTFSPHVPCSCGGILSSMGWTEHLIFNIFFTLVTMIGIRINSSKVNHIETNKPEISVY